MAQHEETGSADEVVARAGKFFRWARYGFMLLAVGFGAAFFYDGFVRYPAQNEAARAEGLREPHDEWDLFFQRLVGVGLPPVALLLLGRWLWMSRGCYRLAGGVLHVPGHPPVPLDRITQVDRRLWQRKGILYVDYEVEGRAGRLKLDDFVYDREATDEIGGRIEAYVTGSSERADGAKEAGA